MDPREFEQVKEIFQSARVLPPGQRTAYLNVRCSNNDHLRHEIERLLNSYDSEFPETLSNEDLRILPGKRLEHEELLGNYLVLEQIGVGGMGEVYLAEDSRLKRKVALKVLPENISASHDRLHRFEQEAIAASGLNHPNILTIYEFGKHDDIYFLASEYVKGESVRQRLQKRKLSLSESIEIAIQVCGALDAAHKNNIVHRDIKPENIMVRDDGLVKVLDFGLAKFLYSVPLSNSEASDVRTRPKFDTLPGTLMGTVAYMSPEQARGQSVDARSDIWSLGVVLYEMITGRLPFPGETNSDKLASILTSQPKPISVYSSEVPRECDHIIKKALGKDPGERYQNIKDFLLDLEFLRKEIDEDTQDSVLNTLSKPGANARTDLVVPHKTQDLHRSRTLYRLGMPLVLVTLLAGGYVLLTGWRPWSKPASLRSLTQIASWKVELGDEFLLRPKFSPDGKFVAYVAVNDGIRNIWVQQIEGGPAFPLRDNSLTAEYDPVWSPEGNQIAFLSTRGGIHGIWRAPAFGGPATLLMMSADQIDSLVKWSADGSTVYFVKKENLYSWSIPSNEIARLTNFDEAFMMDRGFDVSPDESRLAYVDVHQGQIDIWRSGIHGEAPEQVTNDVAEDSTPVWQTDSRRIVFSSERNGIVQVFNYSMNGELEQVTFGNSDSYVSDVSRDGTKVLLVDTKDDADIWRANIDGKQTLQITSDLGAEFWPDVSPNGEAMIYQSSRKMDGASIRKSTIWLRKPIATGVSSQIALAGFEPRFSTDGNRVAYLRSEAEGHSLWVTSTAGGDAHTVTGEGIQIAGFSMSPFSNVVVQDYQWTPSGRTLVYCARRGGLSNVWQVAADGSGEKQLSQNDKPELLFFGPSVSPDGSRLAWLSRSMDIHRRNWCLWGTIDGRTSKLYETDRSMAIAGWSADSRNLILKFTDIAEREIRKPSTLELAYFVFEAGNLVKIGEFNNIYFQSVVASADGSLIGFIERSDDHDAIRCISLSDLKSKMVTSSDEPRVYLNNLLIGPDDRSVFYGKQSRWQIISIIKNFE